MEGAKELVEHCLVQKYRNTIRIQYTPMSRYFESVMLQDVIESLVTYYFLVAVRNHQEFTKTLLTQHDIHRGLVPAQSETGLENLYNFEKTYSKL